MHAGLGLFFIKNNIFLDVLEADTLAKLREGVHTNEGEEDCLDTMERKISEIMAKDSNRRQLQQQAAAGGHNANDLRIMLGGGSRHQSGGFGRGVQGHSAEVGDADAGSSSSGLDSSQENLSQSYWSDQDDNFVLRRRRLDFFFNLTKKVSKISHVTS